MIIPDYQLQSLRTQGYAQYRVPTSDAPCRDDNVIVGGVICHVLMIADDPNGDETVVSVRVGEKPHAPR